MMNRMLLKVTLGLCLIAGATQLDAQTLHTNNKWRQCAIVIDPSLTPAAWRQFVSELGLVTYFRPITSAKPLGRKNVEVGLLDWGSGIDPKDAAWNDTFSHPDSTHWLMEGSTLYIPGLTARMGVTDRMDVGVYATKSIGANYGFVGAQVQYNVWNDSQRQISAAGRLSAVRLLGPADVKAMTYGAEFLVSRHLSVFSPYVGVSGYLARAHETTSKVALEDEHQLGAQATVGVAVSVSAVRVGAEYNLSKVSGISMKIGFGL